MIISLEGVGLRSIYHSVIHVFPITGSIGMNQIHLSFISSYIFGDMVFVQEEEGMVTFWSQGRFQGVR